MMRTTMSQTLVSGLMVASLAVGFSRSAQAHEEGILQPATRQFVAGGTVQLLGKQFGKNTELSLMLVGTRGRLELRRVRTDSSGRFTVDISIPAETVEAEYRLVAIAPDGDTVASVEVVVVAGASLPPSGADEHGTHEDAGGHMANATPLSLERARSGIVTTGVVIFAVVSILAGGLLVRRPAPRV